MADKPQTMFTMRELIALAIHGELGSLPTTPQLKLYEAGDGQYQCGHKECEHVGPPATNRDDTQGMHNVGGIVVCHKCGTQVMESDVVQFFNAERRRRNARPYRIMQVGRTLENAAKCEDEERLSKGQMRLDDRDKLLRRGLERLAEAEAEVKRRSEQGQRQDAVRSEPRPKGREERKPAVRSSDRVKPNPLPRLTDPLEVEEGTPTEDALREQLQALKSMEKAFGCDLEITRKKARTIGQLRGYEVRKRDDERSTTKARWAEEDAERAKRWAAEDAEIAKILASETSKPEPSASGPGELKVLEGGKGKAADNRGKIHQRATSTDSMPADLAVQIIRKAKNPAESRKLKRHAEHAQDVQCIVAANAEDKVCSNWGRPEAMGVVFTKTDDGVVYFPVCRVCKALAESARVNVGRMTFAEAMARQERNVHKTPRPNRDQPSRKATPVPRSEPKDEPAADASASVENEGNGANNGGEGKHTCPKCERKVGQFYSLATGKPMFLDGKGGVREQVEEGPGQCGRCKKERKNGGKKAKKATPVKAAKPKKEGKDEGAEPKKKSGPPSKEERQAAKKKAKAANAGA